MPASKRSKIAGSRTRAAKARVRETPPADRTAAGPSSSAPTSPPTPAPDAHDARIRMSPPVAPVAPPAAAATGSSSGGSAAAAVTPAPAPEDPTRAKLEEVFSPEISAMILEAAFGVAAVVTGEPQIWQASDEEIEPLAPGLGRQLARIPIVRMIGPDNTEGGIVLLGIGVMITRRLNEHAELKQSRARAAREAAAGDRGSSSSEPTHIDEARARRAPARSAEALNEDGTRSAHFGVRG